MILTLLPPQPHWLCDKVFLNVFPHNLMSIFYTILLPTPPTLLYSPIGTVDYSLLQNTLLKYKDKNN